jgi:hypothetical protein
MADITDEEAVRVVTEIAKDDEKPNENGNAPKETRALTRDDILRLGQSPAEFTKVEIPEWGGHVFIKTMTGRERDNYEISQVEGKGENRKVNLVNARAKLVAAVTYDSTKRKMFSKEDVLALGNLHAKPLTRIYKVAQDTSGLTDEDMEDLTAAMGEAKTSNSGSN